MSDLLLVWSQVNRPCRPNCSEKGWGGCNGSKGKKIHPHRGSLARPFGRGIPPRPPTQPCPTRRFGSGQQCVTVSRPHYQFFRPSISGRAAVAERPCFLGGMAAIAKFHQAGVSPGKSPHLRGHLEHQSGMVFGLPPLEGRYGYPNRRTLCTAQRLSGLRHHVL